MTTNKTQKNEDIISMLKGEAPAHGTTITEAIEHLLHENELIANKNKASQEKRAEKRAESNDLKELVFSSLQGLTDGMTATQVMVACNLKNSQQATRLLQDLVKEDRITWEKVKGKSIYKAC